MQSGSVVKLAYHCRYCQQLALFLMFKASSSSLSLVFGVIVLERYDLRE
jgi:hypothetical protein